MTELESKDPAVPTRPVSPMRKLLWIGGVLLTLLVPSWFIDGLIAERQERQQEVRREIGRSWGPQQTFMGPVLVLPWREQTSSGNPPRQGSLTILPETLRAEAKLAPETRRRGLFEATVYAADLAFAGNFRMPRLDGRGWEGREWLWDQAHLAAGSDALRLGGSEPIMRWGEEALHASGLPPDQVLCAAPDALRWPLPLVSPAQPGTALPFSLRLVLRGSDALRLLPLAGRSEINIEAPWATPSFIGADLPERSSVTAEGFSATWRSSKISSLLGDRVGACQQGPRFSEAVGVELLEAVPTYRMVSRAAKYGLFFLALSFVTCGCFEILAKVRIHPMQYAMLGASVVLFPLLLLSLGEAVGFVTAYALTAAAVVVQASAYVGAVTRRGWLGMAMAGLLVALFGFLYVVLSLEAWSLLVGTLAVFLALSVVMAVTRRVEWGQ